MCVLDVVNWLAYDNLKPECVQNCFCKVGLLLNEGTNTDFLEDLLKEINEKCLIAYVDIDRNYSL